MASETLTPSPGVPAVQKPSTGTFQRVARYTAVRTVTLFLTVVVAIYLTIMVANMGGYVDQIMKADVEEHVNAMVASNRSVQTMSPDVRKKLIEEQIALEDQRLGLNTPVAIRNLTYLTDALTLNLGRAVNMTSDSGSRSVRLIVLERLPATLLLMGTSELLMFFASIFLALALSRQYGTFWDKAVIALSPTSAAPAWFYGIFFILLFAAVLKILPFSGMVNSPPPTNPVEFGLNVLQHMILPASALIISQIFLSIYSWRTFFLIYSSEDYVEMAKAKGLTSRDIERRYILRPTLPTIVTSFALLVISLISGAIVTETVFQWPGLGRTLFQAIGLYDTPVIVGLTIIYAYLLAFTVFILDFVYALIDPRVKVGG